ncbi:formyltransferase family protein [Clostridium brassicae]|uniref:phosphoribosylglycinamide formyltransferase 1 n=1 Tax=Clostridium brassicae TaxID=2999072 RepID=A0ABT4DEN3_9CLOT|nr:formyltransferase family protein [Clostridium brassicae]MCY6959566.1 formyltransferase family protein [Clostridium brassicae]
MKKIVFLVSGDGGTLKFIKKCIDNNILQGFVIQCVIADRECGALEFARNNGINNYKITYDKNNDTELKAILDENTTVDYVITNIHKIISEQLVEQYYGKLINLHYSLLPAFKGFNSVKRAFDKGCRFIGTTVHYVDKDIDNGEIISQTIMSIDRNMKFHLTMNKIFQAGCLNLLNTIVRMTNLNNVESINKVEEYDGIIFSPQFVIDTQKIDFEFWQEIRGGRGELKNAQNSNSSI